MRVVAVGLVLVALLMIISLPSVYVWWRMPVEVAPAVSVHVVVGESLTSISQRLEKRGVVGNSYLFAAVARALNATHDMKTGKYLFDGRMTPGAVLTMLRNGDVIRYLVRLPEGNTLQDYRRILSKEAEIVNDVEDLSTEMALVQLGVDVDEMPNGEGWFFPETYAYESGDNASSVLIRAFDHMRSHLDSVWMERRESVVLEQPYELLILASLIEKESAIPADRALISGVFQQRLKLGMRLQSDPTVIYALGDEFDGDLTRAHLRMEHPFNTYRTDGLPPTPIACPSRSSLEAAANPTKTDYLYFVARGDGSSQFSKTLAEHNVAVAEYQKFQLNDAR